MEDACWEHVRAVVVSKSHWPAQSPWVGFVLFLDKKNQKSSQQIGFFARKAFALQTGQNHGLQLFCPAFTGSRSCKNLLCPFLRSWPPLFCPLSPEAYLLTEAVSNMLREFNQSLYKYHLQV
ncbi:hypothetical protein [Mucilaginibacter sp. 3215]|uniref:hypothetical protein n=1 Tax=Mucilaginibacter sp. 3215 TaxID=3373912 RepID=UPI003D1ACB22